MNECMDSPADHNRSHSDAIAQAVLDQFALLPSKRKPLIRPNGVREWVPLAGIVAEMPDGTFKCLSLGTGMRCLPAAKLAHVRGCALHDWHAEVVAIRAFNHFVLEDCKALASGTRESDIVDWTIHQAEQQPDTSSVHGDEPPFKLKDSIALHMYCSEAPCGDASMELTMAAQHDPTPWLPPPPPSSSSDALPTTTPIPTLPGREFFSRLGIVRRKPSRRDAPISMSKSCSDKLALKQCTSLLSAITSVLVAPTASAYLCELVVPAAQVRKDACTRCFSAESGRMAGVQSSDWKGGYAFVPLQVGQTTREFEFSKSAVGQTAADSGTAGFGGATVWHRFGLEESLDGGLVRGANGFRAKNASKVSRRGMWECARQLGTLLGPEQGADRVRDCLDAGTYACLKSAALLSSRREVVDDVRRIALTGWIANVGDEFDRIPTTAL